jgi:hypothetical protein
MPAGRDTVTITKRVIARVVGDDGLMTTGSSLSDILRVFRSHEVGESGLDKRFYEHQRPSTTSPALTENEQESGSSPLVSSLLRP